MHKRFMVKRLGRGWYDFSGFSRHVPVRRSLCGNDKAALLRAAKILRYMGYKRQESFCLSVI